MHCISIFNLKTVMYKIVSLLILSTIALSCKSAKISKTITKTVSSNFYDNQFTGIMIIDPETADTVYQYQAEKYFIPASNTKIATLFSALTLLKDSVPAFYYQKKADTLVIQGIGNPTFLHPYFKDSTALRWAKNYKHVKIIESSFADDKFGPGWAWEDYDTYYSPERTAFPMYGNVASISNSSQLEVSPKYFKDSVFQKTKKISRAYNTNIFYYDTTKTRAVEIPIVFDSLTSQNLWKHILPGKISFSKSRFTEEPNIAYSIPSDSLYKRMMYESDNFLAEQMLIMASSNITDTLNTALVRNYMLDNYLTDLKQKPRWVDGSGLSRYNLFSPLSFVQILSKLYATIPRERLLNFFPVGGGSGTLKSWYGGNPEPYIYAKSGTVGNNYCLSGFLLTKSGKILIFSFMNNHYKTPTAENKTRMQQIFEYVRDTY
ncbi:D-alanyl-D-alanine carboxypeptidase [Formosa algae]|uniref:D-alanyl-D-alanine carboxypeptidase/D-alanyl-D-alanine-endopeptidase (Penicillin-binding protein 4) n=1 Tax=Formosa algae TaxID=225843 RepID=A0A9X1CBM0_9FLAO|nr:D-alanyl-D-alanine carboxypeptidase [Formosa algae]MBP1839269.1 D-alanyl-D-alanine carboxypeptidase/D-alanyl-D-alanine-endopeptidase (penicillin-binding protein 4) [Formosa algae]MDQ0334046.1 D-alanyl-D-alanine carboxypeptidase/D-alanyl-D-alanine-endopeptidase (penicillin-binding protein 4) [Formosa algae]